MKFQPKCNVPFVRGLQVPPMHRIRVLLSTLRFAVAASPCAAGRPRGFPAARDCAIAAPTPRGGALLEMLLKALQTYHLCLGKIHNAASTPVTGILAAAIYSHNKKSCSRHDGQTPILACGGARRTRTASPTRVGHYTTRTFPCSAAFIDAFDKIVLSAAAV